MTRPNPESPRLHDGERVVCRVDRDAGFVTWALAQDHQPAVAVDAAATFAAIAVGVVVVVVDAPGAVRYGGRHRTRTMPACRQDRHHGHGRRKRDDHYKIVPWSVPGP